MSTYGAAVASASVIGRVAQSADARDLTRRATELLAALPAGNKVVTATLAGAGDGHTFVFAVESAPAAEVEGGLDPATMHVRFYLFGDALAFPANRDAAMAILLSELPAGSFIADSMQAGASKGTRFMGVIVGTTTIPTPDEELEGAIALGGVSADPAAPLELIGAGIFYLGNPSTPPMVPSVKSSASVVVATVPLEIYGLATMQVAGVGAVPRTYQGLLNDAPIAASTTRTPASAGYVRPPNFPPIAVPAGGFINGTLVLGAGEVVRNPTLILFTRRV
jgi:hypothetical protein